MVRPCVARSFVDLVFGLASDFNDAEAIAEAVQRPTMKFVAVKTTASLHADETGWEVGEPRLDLTARPLLAKDDRAAAIMADHVE